MRYNAAIALTLAASAAAFPGMNKEAMLRDLLKEKRDPSPVAEPEPSTTGLLGGVASVVGTVTTDLQNIVQGLSGSVGASADALLGDNKRPQPGYVFQAPKSGDSRGPCPGLNLLANYGYLPRNGFVNYEQILTATAEGFNMEADLATVLAVFAILANGNVTTESFYLGTPPDHVGGLNRHSTVEADVSPNREDYYLGCGDNHHLSSRLFSQNTQFAGAAASKSYDLGVMTQQYAANAAVSKQYNPYLYYFPFPLIVSLGAFLFYPHFFSNGTYELGGVPNYDSVSSIVGAKYDSATGNFEYVPERWPEAGWYRRSIPYGAAQVLTEMVPLYLANPIFPGASQVLTPNLNISTLTCDIYQGIESITPLFFAGDEAAASYAASWALIKLDAAFASGTFIGCPTNTISPNFPLYKNASGGPLDPPPSVAKWTGNNVYNKFYFTKGVPTTPQCSHSSS